MARPRVATPAAPRAPGPRDALCHVNGAWVAAADARVSAFDRGFLAGDTVFETLRTYGDHVFLPERHVQRLERSARLAAMRLPWTQRDLADLLREAWRRNRPHRAAWRRDGLPGDAVLRLTVSRGSGSFGLKPPPGPPALTVLVQPLPAPTWDPRGVTVVVAARRRASPDVLDPGAKVGSLMPLVLARLEAERRGAHEALLRNAHGRLAEATSANVFLVRRGELLTPHPDEGLLGGVTRELVLDVARDAGLPVRETRVPMAALRGADEVFLTNTTQELVPVRRIDGRPVRHAPGPTTTLLAERFRERVQRLLGRSRA